MKIAICQTEIVYEDKEYNLLTVHNCIKEAASNGADLALFPEMTMTGFSLRTDVFAEKDDSLYQCIRKLCMQYGICIGYGWAKWGENRNSENHYTVIDKEGEQLSDYIKIHPFSYSGEDKCFKGGNRMGIFSLDGVTFGTYICYDLRFPEIFRVAANEVSVIIVAANWPAIRSKHWECLLRARAVENQSYIIGINCTGHQSGQTYSGGSAVIDPNGDFIIDAGRTETIQYWEINNNIAYIRAAMPVLKDRRPDLYSILEKDLHL